MATALLPCGFAIDRPGTCLGSLSSSAPQPVGQMWTQPSSEPQTRKAPSWEKVARICVLRLWCPLYLVRRLKPAQAPQQPQLRHTSQSGVVLGGGKSDLHPANILPTMPDYHEKTNSHCTSRALELTKLTVWQFSPLLTIIRLALSTAGIWASHICGCASLRRVSQAWGRERECGEARLRTGARGSRWR